VTSFSGMDPELDPELAELLRLEAEERGEAAYVASNPRGAGLDPELAGLDPELAELMRLEEQERAASSGGLGTDPELAAEIQRLEAEERGGF
jgi:hypothetical protein